MALRGHSDALDSAGIRAAALAIADAPQSALGGLSIRQFFALPDSAVYVGITMLSNPQKEAFAWLSERGHEERIAPGVWTDQHR